MSFQVFSSPPLELGGGTLTNAGSATVYYRDELPVSSSANDGSLAPGANVVVTGSTWVVTASGETSACTFAPSATDSPETAQSGSSRPPRRATLTIGSDGVADMGVANVTAICRNYHCIYKAPDRFRLRASNIRPYGGQNLGVGTFGDFYMGTPDFTTPDATWGAWNGAFATAPTKVFDGFTITGGNEQTTPWADNTDRSLIQDGELFAWSHYAAAPTMMWTPSHGWLRWGGDGFGAGPSAADSALAAFPASGTYTSQATVFDVRLDMEWNDGTVVTVLFSGDSITYGNVSGPGSQPPAFSVDSWPAQAGLAGGFIPIVQAVSGSQISSHGTMQVNRFILVDGTDTGVDYQAVPDAFSQFGGTNDIGTTSLATMKSQTLTALRNAHTLGIPRGRLHACTLPPKNWTSTAAADHHAFNNWLANTAAARIIEMCRIFEDSEQADTSNVDLMNTPPHPTNRGYHAMAGVAASRIGFSPR